MYVARGSLQVIQRPPPATDAFRRGVLTLGPGLNEGDRRMISWGMMLPMFVMLPDTSDNTGSGAATRFQF